MFERQTFFNRYNSAVSVKGSHWLILAQLAENFLAAQFSEVWREAGFVANASHSLESHTHPNQYAAFLSDLSVICDSVLGRWHLTPLALSSKLWFGCGSCGGGGGGGVGGGGWQWAKLRLLAHNDKTSRASWPIQPDPSMHSGGLWPNSRGDTPPQETKAERHTLRSHLSTVRALQVVLLPRHFSWATDHTV